MPDCRLPASAPTLRLKPPLEEMNKQNNHPAHKFTPFTFAHVFHLVCDMFNVECAKIASAQQGGLLIRPCDDVS